MNPYELCRRRSTTPTAVPATPLMPIPVLAPSPLALVPFGYCMVRAQPFGLGCHVVRPGASESAVSASRLMRLSSSRRMEEPLVKHPGQTLEPLVKHWNPWSDILVKHWNPWSNIGIPGQTSWSNIGTPGQTSWSNIGTPGQTLEPLVLLAPPSSLLFSGLDLHDLALHDVARCKAPGYRGPAARSSSRVAPVHFPSESTYIYAMSHYIPWMMDASAAISARNSA